MDGVLKKTSESYEIRGVPVFVAYMDGVEVDRIVGFYGVKTFRWMNKLINAAC